MSVSSCGSCNVFGLDDLTEFLTDEILEEWDFFTDFFSDRFPGCEDDTENNSKGFHYKTDPWVHVSVCLFYSEK